MSGSFSIVSTIRQKGALCWRLRPSIAGRAALLDRRTVLTLANIVSDFRHCDKIKDLKEQGFRMVVDMPHQDRFPEISLLAGNNVPNFNPQDWRTPNSTTWDPDAKAPFFELCATTALAGEAKLPSGQRLFNVDPTNQVFGVVDGDPKANTHFLMMATQKYGTMLDQGFFPLNWVKFFSGAAAIQKELGIANDPVRYVANFGLGFQQGPRVHMHVLSAKEGLLNMFPQTYGFLINHDGTIAAPEGAPALSHIIDLIDQRRVLNGYTPEVKQAKLALDQQIFSTIRALGI